MNEKTPKPDPDSAGQTVARTMQEGKMTQLAPNLMQLAEHARNVWCATPEAGTDIDAVLDEKYLAHYANHRGIDIKIGDRIEFLDAGGTFFLEALVRNVGRGFIKCEEMRRVKFGAHAKEFEIDGFRIKFSGPKGWTVTRKADNRRMSENHASQDAAIQWVREHQKAMAA